jgi:hypothetical protein
MTEMQRTTTIKDQVIWDLRDQFFGIFILPILNRKKKFFNEKNRKTERSFVSILIKTESLGAN